MYLIVEENPNCGPEERVFAESGAARGVTEVVLDRPDGTTGWCEVTGVDEAGSFVPAVAQRVEDSAAGVAWLVTGGSWGIRLRPSGAKGPWAIDDKSQWGRPFLVLDDSPANFRFSSERR